MVWDQFACGLNMLSQKISHIEGLLECMHVQGVCVCVCDRSRFLRISGSLVASLPGGFIVVFLGTQDVETK